MQVDRKAGLLLACSYSWHCSGTVHCGTQVDTVHFVVEAHTMVHNVVAGRVEGADMRLAGCLEYVLRTVPVEAADTAARIPGPRLDHMGVEHPPVGAARDRCSRDSQTSRRLPLKMRTPAQSYAVISRSAPCIALRQKVS